LNLRIISEENACRQAIGGIFTLTSVLIAVAYVPCLIAMKNDKELWKSSCIKVWRTSSWQKDFNIGRTWQKDFNICRSWQKDFNICR